MSRVRLNLTYLETFLSLVDTGSFGETGKRLNLAQSTVSQHLKRIEQVIGTALVTRGKRGCVPTGAASWLLPYAQSLLELERRAVQGAAQPLRFGACSNIGVYLLPEILRRYQDAGGVMPQVHIGTNSDLAAQLQRKEIDAALLEWWQERDSFVARRWDRANLVVIVAPDHPLAAKRAVSREELGALPLIGGEPGTGTGHLLNDYFAAATPPPVSLRLGSTEAVKRAVEAGLGASLVLGYTVEKEVAAGRLHAVPLAEPLAKTLWLVRRGDIASQEPLLAFLADAARRLDASEDIQQP